MRPRILATVLLIVGLSANTQPASAHAGARAQLYVQSVSVVPEGPGWVIHALVRDLDSGAPEPGFAVQVTGSGPSGAAFGPLALADPHNNGRYEATVPVGPGPWALIVDAQEIPGGNPALAFSHTWKVDLRAGHAVNAAGAVPSTGHNPSGASAVPLLLALVGALILFGAAAGSGHRRRRAPTRASSRSIA
jgi:hypothetical protein